MKNFFACLPFEGMIKATGGGLFGKLAIQRLRMLQFMVLFLAVSLISCSETELSLQDDPQNARLELTSPNGKNIANSKSGLMKILELPENAQIYEIKYLENSKATVALIDYYLDGIAYNTVLSYGDVHLETKELIIVGNDDKNLSTEALADGDWAQRISCNGDENCSPCGVQAVYYPDGSIRVTCESGCCTMTIRPAVKDIE